MPVLPRHLGVEIQVFAQNLSIKRSGLRKKCVMKLTGRKHYWAASLLAMKIVQMHNLIGKREGGIKYLRGGGTSL